MSMLELVKKDYQEYLLMNKHEMPEGLYESLASHERIPKFFISLAREMTEIERRCGLDRMKIKMITYDMCKIFVNMVKRFAEEKGMSDLEKSRLIAEANKKLTITDEAFGEYKRELETDGVIAREN